MAYQLILENVSSKYGAPMGRADSLPENVNQPVKLHLNKMRMVDSAYDTGGAYWGANLGTGDMYCAEKIAGAEGETENESARVFIRARDRESAKRSILRLLPNASFYWCRADAIHESDEAWDCGYQDGFYGMLPDCPDPQHRTSYDTGYQLGAHNALTMK